MLKALKEFWVRTSTLWRIVIIGTGLLITIGALSSFYGYVTTTLELRTARRARIHAEAEAKKYLEQATKIAREKVVLDKKIAELQAEIDIKRRTAHEASVQTNKARLEYDRVLRNARTDDPTLEQLCTELANLGYPCS